MGASKQCATPHVLAYITVGAVMILILVLGVTQSGQAQTEQRTYNVTIRIGASLPSMQGNLQPFYEPQELPVKEAGENGIPLNSTVTWTNEDESYHTVTSGKALTGPDGLFDSGILSPKVNWSYTFNDPGEYNYYCTVHPFMRGLVKVAG
jgi:plastocyanin